MPPKRKTKRKPPKRSKSQSQSQRQSVIVNVGKTTPAKKKRSGRGGLPPPSYQQNLFPPTIIQQQAPNIAVLENQISRLTSMIQEPTGIKQPETPLSADTGAKNAEARRLAGEQAEARRLAGEQPEARRPGPTAENFQSQPSRARSLSQDLEGFDDEPTPSAISSIPTDFFKSEFSFEGSDLSMPFSMRKRPPSSISSIPTDFFDDQLRSQSSSVQGTQGSIENSLQFINQFDPEQVLRPPDPQFNQTLVNPADPPKMGGGIPFAETRPLRGRPRKNTQQATPIGTPSSKPVKPPKAPKKETQPKTMMDFTKRTEQAGASL